MGASPDLHDVFLCFSGEDRSQVAELAEALEKVGLRVFMDSMIDFGSDISQEIQDALRASRTMLTYYSLSFPGRDACQFELHHAYLAALQVGEVRERILVINPADPDTAHLLPLELRARRYWKVWTSTRELADIATGVAAAARGVGSPFPIIDFDRRPAAVGEPAEPSTGFIGRYRDRWAIHWALHRGEHRLTETTTSRPVAALTGMTGMGKTSLVRVYEREYGFLYPGGVYWIRLSGVGTSVERAAAVHTEQLLVLARRIDGSVPDLTRRQVVDWWHRHLERLGAPTLWVIDDVPAGLPQTFLDGLVPQAAGVHTLLIGQHEFSDGFAESVRIRALTPADGRELFSRHRLLAPDETDAVDEVVQRLGGHPYAILLAADAARGREGLWRLHDRMEHLTSDANVLDLALETVRIAVERRQGAERTVLALAAVCAAEPLPATFIRDVLTAFDPADHLRTNMLLAGLDKAHLIEPAGHGSWRVHQLVREAARHAIAADELATIAAVAAERLIALVLSGTPSLIEHGVALLDRVADSPSLSTALNTMAAQHYDRRGEPALAARMHENLYGLHPEVVGHLLGAARSRQAAGHHEEALAHAQRLTEQSGVSGDAMVALHAARVRAAVLDTMGHHREAEAIWTQLVDGGVLASAPPVERIDVRVAHLRNRRLLGHFTHATTLANSLIAEFDNASVPTAEDVAEALIPVRLELAAIGMATEDQRGARVAAQEVVDHYTRRGLAGHVNAIEAATLLHEAQLELDLFELNPDQTEWATAEVKLRELLATARRTLGRTNPRTLTIAVAHLSVLRSLGRPDRTLDEGATLLEELATHLGGDHRLHLRAVFLLGQAHAQRGDNAEAMAAYQRALAGQETALGPGHPETLRTRYELAVSRWLAGHRAEAKALFRSVANDATREVGRRNDLYGQAMVAAALSTFVPTAVLLAITRYDLNRRKR